MLFHEREGPIVGVVQFFSYRREAYMNRSKSHFRQLTWLIGFMLTAVVAGCGGSDGGNTPGALGTLSVSLTDAPACGFNAVNVTVSKVRVHQSNNADDNAGGWTDITLNPARKINLLDLNDPTQPNFALEHLGETPLGAGHYTQLRLVLVLNSPSNPLANSVVLSSPPNTEIPLATPSAVQSGIKLIHQFNVASGQRVDLLLDFDACKSVVKRGVPVKLGLPVQLGLPASYLLKPVIKVIPFELNGIEGFVDTALFTNEVNVNNVAVSAQINGEIVRATMPNTQTGKFFLARLDAGAGVIYDVVITADDHATAVISGVPVPTTTSITAVSTSGAPIPVVTPPTLEPSVTHSISGTVTLDPAIDDETVLVAAKQALNAGPTVTVKSQVATVLTDTPDPGDYGYSLMLPTGAPSLGPYGPLPIVFDQQPPAIAGQYTVQASATGYTSKSADTNISAGDETQNFDLIP